MIRRFVRGKTPKAQIDSIDHTLQSFSRRLATRAIALTMPVPIIFYKQTPDANGIIGQYVSYHGQIKEVFVHIGKMKKDNIFMTLAVLTDLAQSATRIEIKSTQNMYMVDWKVDAGSLVAIKLEDPTSAEDIYVTLLTYPDVSLVEKEKFMLDSILALEEKEDEGIPDKSNKESS